MIIIVRGEFLSLSVWYCDTLNFFWGCFLSFLRKRIYGPFYFSFYLFLGCRYYYIFLGGCTFFSECVYFFGSFSFTFFILSFSLSLSLFSFLLQVDSVCWCK